MKLGFQPRKWLEKKAKRGWHGYPVGTVAFYGADNVRASKVAVSVVPAREPNPSSVAGFQTLGMSGQMRSSAMRSPLSCASTACGRWQ